MIKAIIFDCFGVLTASTYDRFYATHLNDKPDTVMQIKALDHASNKGSITMDDFYKGIAELTNMPEAEIREFMSQHEPNEELFEYIRTELKPHYKIGFLSNVADDMMDELFTKEQQALFDDVILSYQVKWAKPDIEIFELAAERLGVNTDECVFIDDIQRYVDSADIVGMEAVLYTDIQSLKQALKEIL
ncbi:MAG TPA: HAD-IA family hydrolase [Candidatus Saccharibacteria bacterium]|nr:HAD-IA family hydrolase [Candidatus Saccharibacteria bacterium]HRK94082.1 HAD-IA family hydrolase [Candidatus Saccharibacteria bacterium]